MKESPTGANGNNCLVIIDVEKGKDGSIKGMDFRETKD